MTACLSHGIVKYMHGKQEEPVVLISHPHGACGAPIESSYTVGYPAGAFDVNLLSITSQDTHPLGHSVELIRALINLCRRQKGQEGRQLSSHLPSTSTACPQRVENVPVWSPTCYRDALSGRSTHTHTVPAFTLMNSFRPPW